MANERKKPNTPAGQLTMPLLIKGGLENTPPVLVGRNGRIIYRSSEFYTLRDKLVDSLPDKPKPKDGS